MNAHATKRQLKPSPSVLRTPENKAAIADKAPFWLEDGSLIIPPDKLARFSETGDPADGAKQLKLLIEAEHDRDIAPKPAEWPASVSIATPADEAAIMELLLADVKENAEHIAPADPDGIMEHIQSGTRRRGGITMVVRNPVGKPIAVSILVPMRWWWAGPSGMFYQDLVTYVHPEYRRSRHVHDLIQAQCWFCDQASSQGNRIYLLCGILGMNRVRAKVIMYRRKMRQVGYAFIYPSPFGNRSAT